jgi:hypothetical protein
MQIIFVLFKDELEGDRNVIENMQYKPGIAEMKC